MHLMHGIYTDLGFEGPKSFGELTLDNYQEAFRQNSKLTQARMLQLLKWLGRPVPVDKVKIYDLVVIMQPGRIIFPSVYIGRKMIISSFIRDGVGVFRLSNFNMPIMARRLIENNQPCRLSEHSQKATPEDRACRVVAKGEDRRIV